MPKLTLHFDPTRVTFPSLEAAVSALCEHAFGGPPVIAPLTIDTPAAQATAPTPTQVEPLKGETCPRCLWSNEGLINYGVAGRPDWMCHGCATQENQRLGRIDTALLKLRGIKAITSLDAAEALNQAGAVIEDKNATIARLKDKLAVTAEVMQDNIDIKAEAKRLHAEWQGASEDATMWRDEAVRLADMLDKCESGNRTLSAASDKKDKHLFAYGEFTRNVAAALGMGTHDISFKEVVQRIKEQKEDKSRYEGFWIIACETIRKLTAKINELNTQLAKHTEAKDPAPAEQPNYRRLEEGELIRITDEWQTEGGAWLGRDYVGSAEHFNGGTHQPHRRKL